MPAASRSGEARPSAAMTRRAREAGAVGQGDAGLAVTGQESRGSRCQGAKIDAGVLPPACRSEVCGSASSGRFQPKAALPDRRSRNRAFGAGSGGVAGAVDHAQRFQRRGMEGEIAPRGRPRPESRAAGCRKAVERRSEPSASAACGRRGGVGKRDATARRAQGQRGQRPAMPPPEMKMSVWRVAHGRQATARCARRGRVRRSDILPGLRSVVRETRQDRRCGGGYGVRRWVRARRGRCACPSRAGRQGCAGRLRTWRRCRVSMPSRAKMASKAARSGLGRKSACSTP